MGVFTYLPLRVNLREHHNSVPRWRCACVCVCARPPHTQACRCPPGSCRDSSPEDHKRRPMSVHQAVPPPRPVRTHIPPGTQRRRRGREDVPIRARLAKMMGSGAASTKSLWRWMTSTSSTPPPGETSSPRSQLPPPPLPPPQPSPLSLSPSPSPIDRPVMRQRTWRMSAEAEGHCRPSCLPPYPLPSIAVRSASDSAIASSSRADASSSISMSTEERERRRIRRRHQSARKMREALEQAQELERWARGLTVACVAMPILLIALVIWTVCSGRPAFIY